MAVSLAPSVRRNRGVSVLKSNPSRSQASALDHAVRLIYRVCCLAGSADLIEQIRNENGGAAIRSAIRRHDTAALYDWLMSALSYQGISDRVAYEYMERHGQATWSDLERKLARPVSCSKLKSYWHFHDCRYDKTSRTCAEPYHIDQCPLPTHHLRNGRLNQTAYSLYLFVRDIADGDLAGWIDSRLIDADDPTVVGRLGRMREALIEPLRQVYGLADKVLTMALSCILLAAPKNLPHWIEVGGSMIAIDTLVHNFLHRIGVLRRFNADHHYGAACYRPNGCADIISAVARQIDARDFNKAFPETFPRFVQHAIWRFCAQSGLDICNGNRLDDRKSCSNRYCRLYSNCDRIALVNVGS